MNEPRNPLAYDAIFYNEAISHVETQWQRKLTDHEAHVLVEGYRFGRLIEAERLHHAEQQLREFYAEFREADADYQRGINYGIRATLSLIGMNVGGVNE